MTSFTLAAPLHALPDPLPLPAPPTHSTGARFTLRPPGSKSLTNRLLLLAALADGPSTLHHPLTAADDAERMLTAIQSLGAKVTRAPNAVTITGVAGLWKPQTTPAELHLENAGTATRFLTAAALLAPGPLTIDGNKRMRERPIAQLGEALRTLGAHVAYLNATDCPPIQITPPTDLAQLAPTLDLPTTASSQYISALMLIAPWLPNGLTLRIQGQVTSAPYIHMTADLLGQVGATVHTSESLNTIKVAPGCDPDTPLTTTADRPKLGLPAFDITVEPDASGATYFWAAAALQPGVTVRVSGLSTRSLQGDARFPDALERMGAKVRRSEPTKPTDETWIEVTGPEQLRPVDLDLADMPDAAMTLAACCAFATGPSTLRGLHTLRVKETDRIAALVNELNKLPGVTVENPADADQDAIRITPAPEPKPTQTSGADPVAFDTYDDHRMAMSMALIALRRTNVRINDPACVAKTYPTFWTDFAKLYEPTSE
ncbi:MAG: 3-phosphoshikimate 1-carboxyvinyltransferase [Planctomycetota bacterium]